MNKIERMKAVFAGKDPDYVPAGFWFHYPSEYDAVQTAEAHMKLYRELDGDIIKIMDDSFGNMITKDVKITKASDWRNIVLPGRDCKQYRRMEAIIHILADKVGGEVMLFPTMWSPFKIASFTYVFGGRTDADFMKDCAEDPESVLVGIQRIADALTDWVEGYLAAGALGLYYTGQFSEPQRFDEQTWAKLVKPFDLQVLNRNKELGGHMCGEAEHGYRSLPRRLIKWFCTLRSLKAVAAYMLIPAVSASISSAASLQRRRWIWSTRDSSRVMKWKSGRFWKRIRRFLRSTGRYAGCSANKHTGWNTIEKARMNPENGFILAFLASGIDNKIN